MRLNYICNKIATEILTPGTLVECVTPDSEDADIEGTFLSKGSVYEIANNFVETVMVKEGEKLIEFGFFATRFRKAGL